MWKFEGKYTGEAKAYAQAQRKRAATILTWVFSIVCVILFTALAIVLGTDNSTYAIISVVCGLVTIAVFLLAVYLDYGREKPCSIEITNDSVNVENADGKSSFAFFSIEEIEYYDDFIVINKVVLQKDLLVQGDWAALETFLQKVEENMDTEEPVYQIEEPKAEFLTATVKSKRIYEKFVGKVSVQTLVGVFEYFVTFLLEDGQEMEYQIGQELYEKLQEGQAGTLVLVAGRFFDFGDGEEIEKEE